MSLCQARSPVGNLFCEGEAYDDNGFCKLHIGFLGGPNDHVKPGLSGPNVRWNSIDDRMQKLGREDSIIAAFQSEYVRGEISFDRMHVGIIAAMAERHRRQTEEYLGLIYGSLRPPRIFGIDLARTVELEPIERTAEIVQAALAKIRRDESDLRALAESNPSTPSWLSERFEDPAARISDAGLAEANRRVDAAFLGPYGRGPGMDGLAELRRENAARTEILNARRQMIHEWRGRDDNPLLGVADPDGPLVPPPERAEAEADRTAEIDAQLRAAEIAQDGRGALLHHIGAAADRLRGLSPLPPKPAPKEDAPYVPTRWIGEGE